MKYAVVDLAWLESHGIEPLPEWRMSVDGTKVILHEERLAPYMDEDFPRYAFTDPEFIELLNSEEWTYPEGEAPKVNRELSRILAIDKLSSDVTAEINTYNLTDEEALQVQSHYPTFDSLLSKAEPLPVDFKFQHEGKLYKVLQEHTPQADWLPGTDETKAIYGLVSGSTGEHAGTLDDPIPYERNMVLYEGKYYTQFGEVYLCTRNSIVGYDVDLADPGLASLLEKVE